MNILITSAGRRVKLINYFKNELSHNDRIIVTDCNNTAPALYEADKGYLVPKIIDPMYVDKILEICKIEKVDAIFTLLDPEISLLSKNIDKFEKVNTKVIVSDYKIVEKCFDKYKTFEMLSEISINTPMTYIDIDKCIKDLNKDLKFPLMVKPRTGSASRGLNLVNNIEDLKNAFTNSDEEMIIQEYNDGIALGVDCYVDVLSKEVVSIFIKEKIAMRSGETDKAVSIKDDKLCGIIKNMITKLGVVGPIDIDVFFKDEEYSVLEINPRFGGGYLIAYECGENFPKYIINNIKGIKNKPKISSYIEGMYMLRHDILTMKNKDDLIY